MKDPEILLIVRELAKAARTTLVEASDDLRTLSDAGQAYEAALRQLEFIGGNRELPEQVFPTRGPFWLLGMGWHSPIDILAALARMDGVFVFGPRLSPRRLRTPLLRAFVEVSEEIGRSWHEGAEELSRRQGVVWRLRDVGLWLMPQY